MRAVSSGVVADLQSSGFSGVPDCPSESAGLRANLLESSGSNPDWSGRGRGKAAMAKLVPVISTVLAIIAGPILASLIENLLPPHAQYNSGFQLRGSIAFNSDFQLRGSIK